MSEQVVWDYDLWGGPYCPDHRSVYCEHALDAISKRLDAPHIAQAITNEGNDTIGLAVPLWPTFYMWEDLKFKIVRNSVIGPHGQLIDRGKHATYDLGVNRLLPGESAFDIGMTMMTQFADLIELEPIKKVPGCKSGGHKWKYQMTLEALIKDWEAEPSASQPDLIPHLYGLLTEKRTCAFCWADMYGGDARRVSGKQEEEAKVDDFADLIPD